MGVAQEAIDWWVTMRNNPSLPDRAAYVDWLRKSPAHVAEMLRLWDINGRPSSPELNG